MLDVVMVMGLGASILESTITITMITATAAAVGTNQRRLLAIPAIGRVSVGITPPLGVASDSNCGNNSSAVCQRSAGRFSKQRMTTDSSAAGTVSRCFVTG
jgi:hypothetical protein